MKLQFMDDNKMYDTESKKNEHDIVLVRQNYSMIVYILINTFWITSGPHIHV